MEDVEKNTKPHAYHAITTMQYPLENPALHEDIERLERAITTDFKQGAVGHKSKLQQSHRVRKMVDTMQDDARKLVCINGVCWVLWQYCAYGTIHHHHMHRCAFMKTRMGRARMTLQHCEGTMSLRTFGGACCLMLMTLAGVHKQVHPCTCVSTMLCSICTSAYMHLSKPTTYATSIPYT